MFTKESRYRRVPDITVADARGRTVLAKEARALPEVTGTYLHTVQSGDRLDQLAWTYYGQPLQFWQICDANPDVLSPLALLGQEPLDTDRFPVTAPAGDPPWAAVIAAVSALIGVEDVAIVDEIRLVAERQTLGGENVIVTVERPVRAVVVMYNRVVVGAPAIAEAIGMAGCTAGPPSAAGQVGRPIVVPVAAGG